METITAYKTTNGKIVEDKNEALKIEKALEFENKVRLFADEHGSYEGKEIIYETIMDNVAELKELLKILE